MRLWLGVVEFRAMNSGHWFETLRAILELLYFAAGIAIAVAAFFGLRQIRLTKQIAIKNAKREDLKFAAERCQYFAERVAGAGSTLLRHARNLDCLLSLLLSMLLPDSI